MQRCVYVCVWGRLILIRIIGVAGCYFVKFSGSRGNCGLSLYPTFHIENGHMVLIEILLRPLNFWVLWIGLESIQLLSGDFTETLCQLLTPLSCTRLPLSYDLLPCHTAPFSALKSKKTMETCMIWKLTSSINDFTKVSLWATSWNIFLTENNGIKTLAYLL